MTTKAPGILIASLVLVFTLSLAAAGFTNDGPQATPENPGDIVKNKDWVGCLQAGSAAATYRLNLDPDTAVAGPDDPASLGSPFVQLIGDTKRLKLSTQVGKRVRVTGRELTYEEAVREAAQRPDQQEAAETSAGTGGRPQRHLRYVRIETIAPLPGSCH
jgi:hypothetical protein